MTLQRISWLKPIFIAISLFLASCMFAQTKSGSMAPGVRVPYVGCASDGQVGPLEAPSGIDKVVQVNAQAGQELAYYKAERSPGVLAPRGWYCFGVYGSNGGQLFVSPDQHVPRDFFSEKWRGFSGPAIDVSMMYGDTSGRFSVAAVIARVLPAQRGFVQDVINEGIRPASDFPFGPFPKDKLIYRCKTALEYETPPHTEGLGTRSWLQANDSPIKCAVILEGEYKQCEMDMYSLSVRLTPGMYALVAKIIQQFERDYPEGASAK